MTKKEVRQKKRIEGKSQEKGWHLSVGFRVHKKRRRSWPFGKQEERGFGSLNGEVSTFKMREERKVRL